MKKKVPKVSHTNILEFSLIPVTQFWPKLKYLAIIPRARMGYESIGHEAEGRMGC